MHGETVKKDDGILECGDEPSGSITCGKILDYLQEELCLTELVS
jgi:hypothetical protein